MISSPKILIIGYGNPGRLDDGLGPALAKKIEDCALPGVKVDRDYQLSVEHAFDLSKTDITIFLDASTQGDAAFQFEEIEPESEVSFSSHSVSPQAALSLANTLFKSRAEAHLLTIRGYEFNQFEERLSTRAAANLEEAYHFLVDYLTTRTAASSNAHC